MFYPLFLYPPPPPPMVILGESDATLVMTHAVTLSFPTLAVSLGSVACVCRLLRRACGAVVSAWHKRQTATLQESSRCRVDRQTCFFWSWHLFCVCFFLCTRAESRWSSFWNGRWQAQDENCNRLQSVFSDLAFICFSAALTVEPAGVGKWQIISCFAWAELSAANPEAGPSSWRRRGPAVGGMESKRICNANGCPATLNNSKCWMEILLFWSPVINCCWSGPFSFGLFCPACPPHTPPLAFFYPSSSVVFLSWPLYLSDCASIETAALSGPPASWAPWLHREKLAVMWRIYGAEETAARSPHPFVPSRLRLPLGNFYLSSRLSFVYFFASDVLVFRVRLPPRPPSSREGAA